MTFSPPPTDRVPNPSSDFKYKVLKTGTGVSIRKFLAPDATAVVIPDEIDGLPVVEIGPRAFENRDSLTSAALPSQLATIGERAFYGCSALTKVDFFTIPKFGKEAFYACEALTTVALPVDTETLRAAGFELSFNRPLYDVFESCVVFSADGKTLISAKRLRNAEYVVPDGVEIIAPNAFGGSRIVSVAFPSSLREIKSAAFQWRALQKVVFSEGLETIDHCAFAECDSLTEITFPDSLRRIGRLAFVKCKSLSNVKFPRNLTSIDSCAFEGCDSLEEIALPDGLQRLKGVFPRCKSLRSIKLGAAFEEFDFYSLSFCDALSSLTVSPDNPRFRSVDGVLFSADGKTLYRYPPGRDEAEYAVPDGVETLGEYSFTDSLKLTTVALPASLTNVANFAFPLCSSLSRLTVSPDNPRFRSVDGIVFSADGKTLYLYPPGRDEAEYVVPDGVETIADYAFAHCYALTNIALPNSLRRIGAEAFGFCAELKKIAIPDGLETVGLWAFLGCRALRTLRFGAALREIGLNAFEECSSSLTLSAPEGSIVEQYAKENNRRFRPRRR